MEPKYIEALIIALLAVIIGLLLIHMTPVVDPAPFLPTPTPYWCPIPTQGPWFA
jgi:hypothetical protein